MILLSGVLQNSHQEGFQYLYTGSSSLDLINFGGNLSLELFRLGINWQETLRKVKLKSLVVVLGAGGVILYLMRRSRPPASSWPGQGKPLSSQCSVSQLSLSLSLRLA